MAKSVLCVEKCTEQYLNQLPDIMFDGNLLQDDKQIKEPIQ